MFKLFSYVYRGDKIIKSHDFLGKDAFAAPRLFDYLTEICFELDVPVPIVLKSHINHLNRFNHTKFCKNDFVEEIGFSRLVIQKYEEE